MHASSLCKTRLDVRIHRSQQGHCQSQACSGVLPLAHQRIARWRTGIVNHPILEVISNSELTVPRGPII